MTDMLNTMLRMDRSEAPALLAEQAAARAKVVCSYFVDHEKKVPMLTASATIADDDAQSFNVPVFTVRIAMPVDGLQRQHATATVGPKLNAAVRALLVAFLHDPVRVA